MSETLGTYDNHATPKLIALYRRWAASGSGAAHRQRDDRSARAGRARQRGDRGRSRSADPAAMGPRGYRPGRGTVGATQPSRQTVAQGPECQQPLAVGHPVPRRHGGVLRDPARSHHPEIQDIIQRFGRSAVICKKAGFSGVQIHGAHGYLVNQFLSPHHNHRTDDWGGSPENRRRFVLAVYAEIRRQVGADFPVGIKLNSADFQRGGFTEEESMAIIHALVAARYRPDRDLGRHLRSARNERRLSTTRRRPQRQRAKRTSWSSRRKCARRCGCH